MSETNGASWTTVSKPVEVNNRPGVYRVPELGVVLQRRVVRLRDSRTQAGLVYGQTMNGQWEEVGRVMATKRNDFYRIESARETIDGLFVADNSLLGDFSELEILRAPAPETLKEVVQKTTKARRRKGAAEAEDSALPF